MAIIFEEGLIFGNATEIDQTRLAQFIFYFVVSESVNSD